MSFAGKITKTHVFWCNECAHKDKFYSGFMEKDVSQALKNGWKKIKGKWTCPECVKEARHVKLMEKSNMGNFGRY